MLNKYIIEIYTIKRVHSDYGLMPNDKIICVDTMKEEFWLPLIEDKLIIDKVRAVQNPYCVPQEVISIAEKWLKFLPFA